MIIDYIMIDDYSKVLFTLHYLGEGVETQWLPDDWVTTVTMIRETGNDAFGVSSGQRADGEETRRWN